VISHLPPSRPLASPLGQLADRAVDVVTVLRSPVPTPARQRPVARLAELHAGPRYGVPAEPNGRTPWKRLLAVARTVVAPRSVAATRTDVPALRARARHPALHLNPGAPDLPAAAPLRIGHAAPGGLVALRRAEAPPAGDDRPAAAWPAPALLPLAPVPSPHSAGRSRSAPTLTLRLALDRATTGGAVPRSRARRRLVLAAAADVQIGVHVQICVFR
jgi:hypothetical protein